MDKDERKIIVKDMVLYGVQYGIKIISNVWRPVGQVGKLEEKSRLCQQGIVPCGTTFTTEIYYLWLSYKDFHIHMEMTFFCTSARESYEDKHIWTRVRGSSISGMSG